jgi:hypothetical protein
MRKKDTDHESNKKYVRDFPDAEILREAMEIAALDDREKEALRLYVFRRVPIGVIAERMGYEKTYFSQEKFKKILVKYVYCLYKVQKQKNGGA